LNKQKLQDSLPQIIDKNPVSSGGVFCFGDQDVLESILYDLIMNETGFHMTVL
jgi:hypothetical protein